MRLIALQPSFITRAPHRALGLSIDFTYISLAIMGAAYILSIVYNVVGMLPFALMNAAKEKKAGAAGGASPLSNILGNLGNLKKK